jgi:hypothetical protein
MRKDLLGQRYPATEGPFKKSFKKIKLFRQDEKWKLRFQMESLVPCPSESNEN